jgi:hypothetical protein
MLGAAILSGVLSARAAHAAPELDGVWVSLSAQCRTGTWLDDWAGMIALNIPLDRTVAPRAMRAAQSVAEEPPKKESGEATSAPAAAQKRVPLELRIAPRLARSAVHHALAVAGYYGARARLASLSGRARSSAVLPELRLRTLRSTGQNLRLTPTPDNPYGYTQAGTSELLLEARLTWHLDRLLFAEQEVSLERLQNERDAAERKLVEHVLERLVSWQRNRVRAADEDIEPEIRQTAELEALGAVIELDVLTDGWFSQAIGESEDTPKAATSEKPKPEVDTPRHAR